MSSAGKLLAIKLPDQKVTKLNVNADTTVGQVNDILAKSVKDLAPGDEYGISMDSIVFDRNSKIAKIPADQLMYRKILFTLNIRDEGKQNEPFRLDPLLTVKETILFVEHSNLKANTYSIQTRPPPSLQPNHEITLYTNSSNSTSLSNGIKLEYDRTLQSYRLTSEDLLVLSPVQSKSAGAWKSLGGESSQETCLIITATEHNLQKAMKFSPDTTFASVTEKFLQRANLKMSKHFFGIFLNVGGEFVQMQPQWNMTSFPLPSPAKLECKYLTRAPKTLFGVDPLTLTFVNDNGFHVPEILAILKDMLILSDGIDCEGVFRKSGLESEMTTLKEQLHAGKAVICDNTHSIATMMKRWFKELPKRLFAHVDPGIVDNDGCCAIQELLNPLEQSLFYWLLDLLLLVSAKSEQNFMTPSNLGIVWGPGMTGSSTDSVDISSAIMDSFNETRLGISIIEKNVSYFIEKKVPIPRIDLTEYVYSEISDDFYRAEFDSRPKKYAHVLFDNTTEKEGEITITKGSNGIILDDSNQDWVLIEVGNKIGYIPRNYIKIGDRPEVSANTSAPNSPSSAAPTSSNEPKSIATLLNSSDGNLKPVMVLPSIELRPQLKSANKSRPSSSRILTGSVDVPSSSPYTPVAPPLSSSSEEIPVSISLRPTPGNLKSRPKSAAIEEEQTKILPNVPPKPVPPKPLAKTADRPVPPVPFKAVPPVPAKPSNLSSSQNNN